MKTYVYVDGFNFYYGCVKGTRCKWLDFSQLCAKLLTRNEIAAIKYFSARVIAPPHDPDQPTRQDAYFRALRTMAGGEVILGHFLTHEVNRRRVDGGGTVRVYNTEEKGSDVNLATHLIHDAHMARMECAVLVTNDSDLAEPVRIVRHEIGIPVGIISPTTRKNRYPSRELTKHATFTRRVRKGVLRDSQFPNPIVTAGGEEIHRPSRW